MPIMLEYTYPFLIVMVVVLFVFVLSRLRKATTFELERTLYAKNDPELYLALLANPRLRLLYRKTTILLFTLNAQLLKGDDPEIVSTLRALESAPLSRGEKLEYLSKKLSYFCEKQNILEAGNALAGIEKVLKNPKPNQAAILHECRLIYSIYIEHDSNILKTLEDSLQQQNDSERILTYYRIAKLKYYTGDKKGAKETLLLANNIQSQSAWRSIVAMAYDDLSILDRK